jgi:hypothetical protein
MEEPIKKPRRNVMNSIRRRLNSGAYNKTRNLKRNERAVRDKLRAYEKKGELKGYMAKRYDEVLDIMGRLDEIKEIGAAVVSVPIPISQPKKFIIKSRIATSTVPLMTLKKRRAKNVLPYVVPEFNPPPANLPPMPIPYGEYNREGDFHIRGTVGALEEQEPLEENIGRFGYVTKKVNKNRAPKTLKKTRSLKNENMQYMERVHKSFLPLPELYNPYTGVKYLPEEDPLPNIQSAHEMLDQILERAKRKALALKRREQKKTQAKAGI